MRPPVARPLRRFRRGVIPGLSRSLEEQFVVECPYCGELIDLYVEADVTGVFVQDCEVCCNPWRVQMYEGGEGRSVTVARADGSE